MSKMVDAAVSVMAFVWLLQLALLVGVIWVAWYFISKWW